MKGKDLAIKDNEMSFKTEDLYRGRINTKAPAVVDQQRACAAFASTPFNVVISNTFNLTGPKITQENTS